MIIDTKIFKKCLPQGKHAYKPETLGGLFVYPDVVFTTNGHIGRVEHMDTGLDMFVPLTIKDNSVDTANGSTCFQRVPDTALRIDSSRYKQKGEFVINAKELLKAMNASRTTSVVIDLTTGEIRMRHHEVTEDAVVSSVSITDKVKGRMIFNRHLLITALTGLRTAQVKYSTKELPKETYMSPIWVAAPGQWDKYFVLMPRAK